MIKRGSKQRAGRASLRKREKTNGFLGLKQVAGRANPNEKKRKQNGFIGLKTQGGVGQSKEKRENKWNSRG